MSPGALVRETPVLLLDEPTTESKLQTGVFRITRLTRQYSKKKKKNMFRGVLAFSSWRAPFFHVKGGKVQYEAAWKRNRFFFRF